MLEEAAIYERIDFASDGPEATIPLQPGVTDQVLSVYLCPSNSSGLLTSPIRPAAGHRGVDLGGHARSDYKGCLGSQGSAITGMFGKIKNYAKPTRIRDVLDGTTHTFAVGEAYTRWMIEIDGPDHPNAYDFGVWVGTNNQHQNVIAESALQHIPNGDRDDSFASSHAGVVQMAFADGSVQTISENVDMVTYQFWGTRPTATRWAIFEVEPGGHAPCPEDRWERAEHSSKLPRRACGGHAGHRWHGVVWLSSQLQAGCRSRQRHGSM